jgi:hypothetical protein
MIAHGLLLVAVGTGSCLVWRPEVAESSVGIDRATEIRA